MPIDDRNPWIASILSVFFPGWGQWYNGKTWDGLKFFIGVILVIVIAANTTLPFIVIIIAIWLYGIDEAWKTAGKINRGEERFTKKSGLFWLPIPLLFLIVVSFYGMIVAIQNTKVVSATAQQTDSTHIVVTYQGGQDANIVRQLTATVTDSAGNSQTKTIGQSVQTTPLQIGSSVTFTGAFSGKNHVVAVATFFDGTTQVIFDNYIISNTVVSTYISTYIVPPKTFATLTVIPTQ
jgi:hypothetical protein